MKDFKRFENRLLVMFTVSLLATIGSLYFSEIKNYTPCELCWIQRIFMYPNVIILGFALLKKDIQMTLPTIVLSGIGMCISIYHYGLQKLPALQDAGGFCGEVPCNLQYVNYFGFITIPFLAGVAFILLFVTHVTILLNKKRA